MKCIFPVMHHMYT